MLAASLNVDISLLFQKSNLVALFNKLIAFFELYIMSFYTLICILMLHFCIKLSDMFAQRSNINGFYKLFLEKSYKLGCLDWKLISQIKSDLKN